MSLPTIFLTAAGGVVVGFACCITIGLGSGALVPAGKQGTASLPSSPIMIEQPTTLEGAPRVIRSNGEDESLRTVLRNIIAQNRELARRIGKVEAAGKASAAMIDDLQRELEARNPLTLDHSGDVPIERVEGQ